MLQHPGKLVHRRLGVETDRHAACQQRPEVGCHIGGTVGEQNGDTVPRLDASITQAASKPAGGMPQPTVSKRLALLPQNRRLGPVLHGTREKVCHHVHLQIPLRIAKAVGPASRQT